MVFMLLETLSTCYAHALKTKIVLLVYLLLG
jgi:hypothetical protein